jgi:glutamyl-tRNA reductase
MISTCNRFELYFSGEEAAMEAMQIALCQYKKISLSEHRKYINIYSGERAIRHLFHVTCGLDSMVLGEDEILGQVKDAYNDALEQHFTDTELNIAFQGAISCSKFTKTETLVSNIPLSIGTLTANCAFDFLKSQNAKNILIIGITGKMGSIVAKNLASKGDFQLIGFSRTHVEAQELFATDCNIQLVEYKDRMQYLTQADVIISATTSPHYTFTYHDVSKVLKDNERAKLFIDLAIPFDMDKEIATIPNCTLLDIDYFKKAAKDNNTEKLKEYEKVEVILEAKLEETLKNIYIQQYQPVIRNAIERVKTEGLDKLLYHVKNDLSSQQLIALLDAIKTV